VEAPEATDAFALTLLSSVTSTSTVGLPRESSISRALIFDIFTGMMIILNFYLKSQYDFGSDSLLVER
jgi:hypothetical protein